MTNYTHRNIHSLRRCAVVREENYDGHVLYQVQVEGEDHLRLWSREAFRCHHVEIEEPQS